MNPFQKFFEDIEEFMHEANQRHAYSPDGMILRHILASQFVINKKLDFIMATQKDIADGLVALKTQVTKIGTESSTTLQKVTDLEAQLANLPDGTVTPELQAAFDDLKTSVQTVDDLIADAVVPAPPVDTTPVDTTPTDGSTPTV